MPDAAVVVGLRPFHALGAAVAAAVEGVQGIEGVDPTRTTTNDIHEISEILGIEAARNALIKEAHAVLEEQGLDVDIRHVMLVSDIMSNSGQIQQIGRHGISGKKSSVLARAM